MVELANRNELTVVVANAVKVVIDWITDVTGTTKVEVDVDVDVDVKK